MVSPRHSFWRHEPGRSEDEDKIEVTPSLGSERMVCASSSSYTWLYTVFSRHCEQAPLFEHIYASKENWPTTFLWEYRRPSRTVLTASCASACASPVVLNRGRTNGQHRMWAFSSLPLWRPFALTLHCYFLIKSPCNACDEIMFSLDRG